MMLELSQWMACCSCVVVIVTTASFMDLVAKAVVQEVNKGTGTGRFRSASTDARRNSNARISDTTPSKILPFSYSSIDRELSGAATDNISNPYTTGCLHAKELVSQIRVCNSEDPLDAATSGICRIPDVDYMEIRIFSDNWESITFEAWILQIILSELLDVPTTIEAGSYEGSLNFYHPDAPMEYGTPRSDNDALEFADGSSSGW